MKRIVTIQDISCVGKCSLTVALPIISAMGIETAVIPTAVLSNHTAFKEFTFRDLTEDITPISDMWAKEGLDFDAIYTGYMGSAEQIEVISEFIDRFRTDRTIVIADPAMADNGELYKGFSKDFVLSMRRLCGKADVIVPNLTEASFMLDIPFRGDAYTEEDIRKILKNLTEMGAKNAVLTGVSYDQKHLGAAAYDSVKGKYYSHFGTWYPARFHGTGDIYASAMTGALVNGMNLDKAIGLAVDYTAECVRFSIEDPEHRWYGVNFESAIPMLTKLASDFALGDGSQI